MRKGKQVSQIDEVLLKNFRIMFGEKRFQNWKIERLENWLFHRVRNRRINLYGGKVRDSLRTLRFF
ncbi:hypothetical protein B0E43_04630 [Algoriphagus sp. A40]|nr:hypothetical protein B0E43_04630 [Algoriphagus sp. A40]